MIRRIGWYPPYLGAGIRVKSCNAAMTRFEVELRQRWYNRNLFGTHFGGSLYAMADPFFVFIVTLYLGKGYVVWDKSAAIEFLQPGTGTITGIFEIPEADLAALRADVDQSGRNTYHFTADLTNAAGEVVARVTKEVYVRVSGEPKPPA